MWDVIVLIPDHCFSIYFAFPERQYLSPVVRVSSYQMTTRAGPDG